MKSSSLLLGFLLGGLFLLRTDSHAQWQPDVRLTNDSASSHTSFNNSWCVAASGNIVHVAWYDTRDGNYEIYFKRSTDGGISWGSDTRLTNDAAVSQFPSISVSGSVVHVVWYDSRDGNNEIYYKRSTDAGVSWGADTRLTSDASPSDYPSASVSGSVVHAVWREGRDGNWEIYYNRSTDAGITWDSNIRLTNNSSSSFNPSVSAAGSIVHVAWYDIRDGNNEVYYKRSTDGGISWGTDNRLTNNSGSSIAPSISVSASDVHVVWEDDRDGNKEIYYKHSTDAGVSWGQDTRISDDVAGSYVPSVVVSGLVVLVVWADEQSGNREIYHIRSTDAGANWEQAIHLTNASEESWLPSISVSDSIVHVVWRDQRDGNYEIYYKRNPTGRLTGVDITNSEIPGEFEVHQNYPNPFNPTTKIAFSLPRSEFATLRVFNTFGERVATLVSETVSAGTHQLEWNAEGWPSGVYFYHLQAGALNQTRKSILLK